MSVFQGLWMDLSGAIANIHMRTGTNGDHPHDLYVAKGSFVQEVFNILLTFPPKIAWQIASQRLRPSLTI